MQQSMLVGLIGANIQKSLAPALFEDACAATGIRGHYHLMDLDRLPGRTLGDLVGAARAAGFKGFNVTYPCKEAVLPMLDDVSPDARQIGAVNTVSIAADRKTKGFNTDRIGFRRAFEEVLAQRRSATRLPCSSVREVRGGRWRSLSSILACRLCWWSTRTPTRHAASRWRLPAHSGPSARESRRTWRRHFQRLSGVVNATPVGMLGIPGDPVPIDAITAGHWVADVIYTPLETRLIETARAKGARVMGGAGMCVHQAAETFKIFTGLPADVHRMQRTFAEAAAVREKNLAAG